MAELAEIKAKLGAELGTSHPQTHPRPLSVNVDQVTLLEYSRTQIGRQPQLL